MGIWYYINDDIFYTHFDYAIYYLTEREKVERKENMKRTEMVNRIGIDEVLSTNSVVGLIMERNLPSGQTYTYTVRAYCKVNGKIILGGYDSKGSSATT